MFAGLVRIATGVQDRWEGIEPLPPDGALPQRIYFANHTSHLDAPVIWAALPPILRARTRPVAARDYWDADPLRRFLSQQVMRVVLVDRSRGTPGQSASALDPMIDALSFGDSLILFPEGTRNPQPDDGLLPFKSGLYHLAARFPAIQVVPSWLSNVSRILPKGEFAVVPLIARVTFGPPVPLNTDDDKVSYLQRARRALTELAAKEAR